MDVSGAIAADGPAASSIPLAKLVTSPQLWILLAASAGLYLSGMVLNDVFDAELDQKERPERPIPSGRISRTAAGALGMMLMLAGLTSAALAGTVSLIVAVVLAVCVIAYDRFLKTTPAGPLVMGMCRSLNLLLGFSSAVPSLPQLLEMPQAGVAAALGIYVVGVTLFARNEAGNASLIRLVRSVIVLGIALAGYGGTITLFAHTESSLRGGLLLLGLLAVHLLVRCVIAIRSGVPRILQQTVGLMLLSIVVLDAAVVLAITGSGRQAIVVLALMIPARLLKRIIPMS